MNNINIDRPKITTAEVNQYKDFQALMNRYSRITAKAPLKKRGYKFGIPFLSVVLVSLFVWLILIPIVRKSGIQRTRTEGVRCINPPFPQANIPFTILHIRNLKDTILYVSPVACIEIGQNSLIDSAGNPVNDSIEIRYRQFMNPAEIFLSGIPMIYDSAGHSNTFESAGMIEIGAFFRNRPLLITPEKPVRISFRSSQTGNDYNLYYLDTVQRNWVYKEEDGVEMQKELKFMEQGESEAILTPWVDSLKQIRRIIADLRQQKPEPPVLANPQKWHFKIDILENEFPELSLYSKTVFEIDDQYRALNPSHPAIDWEDVIISRSEKPMHYYVTFKKDTITAKYRACPVLNGESYQLAFSKYEELFETYQRELAQRKEREDQVIRQLIFRQTLRRNDSITRVNNSASRSTENFVIRSFKILNFGIWNYDKALKYDRVLSITPTIIVNDSVYHKTFYRADLTRNALITVNPGNNMEYEKESRSMLWMVAGRDRIAVFTAEDFSSIPSRSASFTFHLRLIDKTIHSSEDFLTLFEVDFKENLD